MKDKSNRNSLIMNILVVLGVIVLCVIIVYLMNYFFVEKSHIKINISTDKKLEFIMVGEEDELVTTQKYVSDLNYSMRYITTEFTVFKYKEQDIYKNVNNDSILVVVEPSDLPSTCPSVELANEYNSCYLTIDNYTDEYYISNNNNIYKLTVKKPNAKDYTSFIKSEISYMINSFEINHQK
ncbi:MAG: hypothetical protein E7313_06470 [Clostridiales bacterium]|nr:hypothetical protein [Clostridiales bacterium]